MSYREGSTLFMIFTGIFQIVLSIHSGQNDISIGTTVLNRTEIQSENIVGPFVNTLVVRNKINEDFPFLAFLKQAKQTMLDAYDHQQLPFDKLVEIAAPVRESNRLPLIQVVINWLIEQVDILNACSLIISPLSLSTLSPKYDISLNLSDRGDHISGSLVYNSGLFSDHTIDNICSDLLTITNSISQHRNQSVAKLRQMINPDYSDSVATFNA